MYKIITNKAFTNDEDSHFEKIEPPKKFKVVHVPRRDDDNRLMGPLNFQIRI